MAISARFSVLGWTARQPAAETGAWQAIAGAPAAAADAVALPMMLRRRLSPLGQAATGAAGAVGQAAQAQFVFCSRHGEMHRTVRLMQALATGETVSPADFSLSVHNALAGLLSIATGARAGHTAVTAGADSFAAGVLEAAALLRAQPRRPVLLAYYDEPVPPPFEEVGPTPPEGALALAALLAPGEDVALDAAPEPGAPTRATTAQAAEFLAFLAGEAAEVRSPGGRLRLEWRRAGA